MVRPLLALLREKGVDIKSPHRRRATSKMSVARSALEGREARVVLDCGAHHGAMTRAFRAAFPSATVYAFEPTPATFGVLSRRLAGLDRVELVNAAVGAEAGSLDFYIAADEQSNSLVRPSGDAEAVRVRVVALGDFCRERGISHVDLLKLDVEGYELQALRGMEDLVRAHEVDVIMAEVRFDRPGPGATDFVELVGYLQGMGYRFFGFYDTLYEPWLEYAWGDIVMVSPKARERMRARRAR